jgi:hypothetical protein
VTGCFSRSPRGGGTVEPSSRCPGRFREQLLVAAALAGARRGLGTATAPGPPGTSTERTGGEVADMTGKNDDNCKSEI